MVCKSLTRTKKLMAIKIALIAGARPNFMKVAPLMHEFRKHRNISVTLIHTGQHYDDKLSRIFFRELDIPEPEINLNVGSAPQALQTLTVVLKLRPVFQRLRPDLVLVVGDVNSTLAASVAANLEGIRVGHVEAGLRSFDFEMPEEFNRLVTDRISDFLFCTEPSALQNLKREGIPAEKIFFVGNVMIDTLKKSKVECQKSKVLKELGLKNRKYAVTTLHRPSNVDDKTQLKKIMDILQKIGKKLPVVFPVHPRTQKNMERWRISSDGLLLTPPLGYRDFLKLVSHAKLVLTDSGGIQEETTILGIPCLTLRENTERPITVEAGTNVVTGLDPKKIWSALERIMTRQHRSLRPPKFWDGKAAERIVKILEKKL